MFTVNICIFTDRTMKKESMCFQKNEYEFFLERERERERGNKIENERKWFQKGSKTVGVVVSSLTCNKET